MILTFFSRDTQHNIKCDCIIPVWGKCVLAELPLDVRGEECNTDTQQPRSNSCTVTCPIQLILSVTRLKLSSQMCTTSSPCHVTCAWVFSSEPGTVQSAVTVTPPKLSQKPTVTVSEDFQYKGVLFWEKRLSPKPIVTLTAVTLTADPCRSVGGSEGHSKDGVLCAL